MKKMLAIIGVAALLATMLVPTAATAGPTENSGNATVSLPTLAASGSTNLATPAWIGAEKQQNVAVMFSATSGAVTTNACAQTYGLAPSVDGSVPDLNRAFTVTATIASGGTNGYVTTNLNALGYTGYFITGVTNANAGANCTNSVKYRVKIGWP